jgi:Right handed beta helix region
LSLFVCRSSLAQLLTTSKLKITLQRNRRFLLMTAVLISLSSLAFSATVAVGTCTNLAFYSSIQTAVNSVPAGSTIRICPGIYAEQVLITKKLTLTGVSANGTMGTGASGANNPTIVSPAAGVAVNAFDLYDNSGIAAQIAVVTPTGVLTPIVVNISNITVDGSNSLIAGCAPDLVGIYYSNASGIINHVATRFQELGSGLGGCQSGLAIFVESGYGSGGTSVTTIENSSVHDYQKNGITVDGSGTTSTVMGNYVVGAGATTVIAQNGIQVSDGANGKVTNNTVTDDVYISPDDGPYYSATGILLYDSGGTSATNLVISGNTVSNSQGGIVAYSDNVYGTADYNTITTNKVTTSPAAGPFLLDGIDLCSDNNTARSNVVFNSSGSGIHIDSQCTGASGPTGNNTTVTGNTIDEACAGVLTGNGTGSSQSGNNTFSVLQTVQAGDSCPVGAGAKTKAKVRPLPLRH